MFPVLGKSCLLFTQSNTQIVELINATKSFSFFIFLLGFFFAQLFAICTSQVDVNSLDPKLAYIQLTHVIPFFTKDELDQRLNEFEQNHDVDTFMYETPFTKSGTAHGTVDKQWKRKTMIKSKSNENEPGIPLF